MRITDPAGRWKQFTRDAFGDIVKVQEPTPHSGSEPQHVTSYAYDVFGHLIQVTMPRTVNGTVVTQTRTWTYDLQPLRLLSQTSPEAGPVTYTYNSDNTLATVTDAKSQRAVYSHDQWGRVSQIARGTVVNGVFTEDTTQRAMPTSPTNNVDPSGLCSPTDNPPCFSGGTTIYGDESPDFGSGGGLSFMTLKPNSPPPTELGPTNTIASFQAAIQTQYQISITNLSKQVHCGSVLPISQLQSLSINFFNGSDPLVADLSLSSIRIGQPSDVTVAIALNSAGAAGVIPAFTLVGTNAVILGPAFNSVTTAGHTLEQEEENTLQHEALHVLFQEGDVQVANKLFCFPLQTPPGTTDEIYDAAASVSIGNFLFDNCKD